MGRHLLDIGWVASSSAIALVVTAVALRCAVRLLARRDETSRTACRRWQLIAGGFAVLAWTVGQLVAVASELLLMAAIAALDCWLVVAAVPGPALPRAMARPAPAGATP